jgi:hypothetical protein
VQVKTNQDDPEGSSRGWKANQVLKNEQNFNHLWEPLYKVKEKSTSTDRKTKLFNISWDKGKKKFHIH